MKNSAIKAFIVLFIIFPSFVGCYALFLGSIEARSDISYYNGGEEVDNELELLSNIPQVDKDRSDIDYKPIESTLNLSRIVDRAHVPLDYATDTVEYNLRTGVEKRIGWI